MELKNMLLNNAEKAEEICDRKNGLVPRMNGHHGLNRPMDDAVLDYDSSYESSRTSSFEFQKGEKGIVKSTAASYVNKTAPSKWDDAEKWLVSPMSGDGFVRSKTKSGPLNGYYGHGAFHVGRRNNVLNQHEWHGHSHSTNYGHGPEVRNLEIPTTIDAENQQESTKLVTMVHSSPTHYQPGADHIFAFAPTPSSLTRPNSPESSPSADLPADDKKEVNVHGGQKGSISTVMSRTHKPTSDSFVPTGSYSSPSPAVRSISMRDMGTEMTPITSQEPSRTGTPIRATTPTFQSPDSSSPASPKFGSPIIIPADVSGSSSSPKGDRGTTELSAQTIRSEVGRGVQSPGIHVGGKLTNIPWSSKEEEDADASKSLKNVDLEEVKKNVLETRATAWEQVEQSKYMARFKREEAKISAWESHEKAKAEAELRRFEMRLEKMRVQAHEKLLNKLEGVRQKAEERRAAAEAKKCEQAAKTSHQADYIRQTGRLPTSCLSNFCL
ncbi:hypothetical protein KP509_34G020100 [Ceratopteris richardii]|uniref:Remorin C-terminal domain-containing protein n=1 Tax=Ceratopteris richardii TaxID=49495 RepID=A0A8T2QJB0_CERRI|nr:hypothetical protein KP509_34G020100 [Ceratopteris richardii]